MVAHPRPAARSFASTCTTRVGDAPPRVGMSSCRAAIPRAAARASCRFWPALRRSNGSSSSPAPVLPRSSARSRSTSLSRSPSSPSSNRTPGFGGPSVFGLHCASNTACICAATSGSRFPRIAWRPLRRRPMVKNRWFCAPRSVGSGSSGSIAAAIMCAYPRRSSGVAGGARGSFALSAVSGSAAASASSGESKKVRCPRAQAANRASASRTVSRPTLCAALSIGPTAASIPATPITPSSIASRNAGNLASSRSPELTLICRRTASAAFPTRVAPATSVRSTRCSNSFWPRHPNECEKSGCADAVVSTTTASILRNASPATRSTCIRSASGNPASTSADSTRSRSATTRSRSSSVLFIPPVNPGPPTFRPRK